MDQSFYLSISPTEHRAWSATYGNNVYVSFTMIRNYAHAGLLFSATITAMQRDARLAYGHAERSVTHVAHGVAREQGRGQVPKAG